MSTQVTTRNPVRTDLDHTPSESDATTRARSTSRTWAYAGVAAGVAAGVCGVAAGMIGAVYDPDLSGDVPGMTDEVARHAGAMTVLHVSGALAAVLLLVFAAGLYRRLRAGLTDRPDSLLPGLAALGLAGTSFTLMMATAMDTEFIFAAMEDSIGGADSSAVGYNRWIGMVPSYWLFIGVTGLAVWRAARLGAAPRWIGRTGLLLGGLSLALAVAPVQYISGATGTLMLLGVALGFAFGDRARTR